MILSKDTIVLNQHGIHQSSVTPANTILLESTNRTIICFKFYHV